MLDNIVELKGPIQSGYASIVECHGWEFSS